VKSLNKTNYIKVNEQPLLADEILYINLSVKNNFEEEHFMKLTEYSL